MFDCNELKLWCTNIKTRMTADTLDRDVIKAEALKEKHNEHLVSYFFFKVFYILIYITYYLNKVFIINVKLKFCIKKYENI